MKIIESLPQSYKQSKQQANQQAPADFEHWLNNPAKQSTGDEYYWQHQTQLQHSELHFDAKPLQSSKTDEVSPKQSEPVVSSSTQVQETQYFALLSTPIAAMENATASHQSENKLMPLLTALEQALEQSPVPMPIHTNQYTQDTSASKEVNNVSNSMTTTLQFKNNHLFIQGEQAELTLNLHTLDKQEQNELVQLIHNYLKKKGLVLSRLIINGVNND
ncbi:hypothetical protein ACD661_05570 [Legionella lytica]|uniref:Flagellar hook-length control protein FliK n=1 Tax=Legionella lytica TaxID=96232 RepID=A0ABW8D5P4_9GAMM